METIPAVLSYISSIVWGAPLLILLICTHIYLTVRLRFIQRHLLTGIKLSVARATNEKGEISPFAALSTALASTIGTGNLIGVGSAIATGGPGAVLWMWLTGVLGFATKYSEAVLAITYRIKRKDGRYAGGPMYVLENGLKSRYLGVFFATVTAIAAFGIGNMVQANSLSSLAQETLSIEPWITGIALSLITAFAILGGLPSISKVCTALVPFMAAFYVVGCVVLLLLGMDTLPDTILLILKSAFSGEAAAGGFVGATIQQALRAGVSRGLFSNESGLGSAPIVAAAAQTKNPIRQGLVSATGTFWDTVVICLLTGLVLVNSGAWREGTNGNLMTHVAFEHFAPWGPIILTVALFTFVYSTILGWAYYGERAIEYLIGEKAVRPYRILWVIAVFIGAVSQVQAVWDFADIANGLMAIPNLIALILLSSVVVRETKKYLWSNSLDASSDETR